MTATTYGEIEERVFALKDETQRFREDLARHPELSGKERRTSAKIVAELAAVGLRSTRGRGGIIAEFGPRDAPVEILTADMDALKMPDLRDVPYKSQNDGVHHGCGHDATTAGLVTAAKVLKALDDRGRLENRIRLAFRYAEENGKGAKDMIVHDNVLDFGGRRAQAVFGAHAWPTMRVGQYGVRQGPTQFSAAKIELRLTGKGGHSARPGETHRIPRKTALMVDRIEEAVDDFYAHLPEDERPVFAWGYINSGTAMNVIPGLGEAGGTMRTATEKMYQNAPAELRKIAAEVAAHHGIRDYRLRVTNLLPPVVNTAAPEVRGVLGAAVGPDAVEEYLGSKGGDDVAYFGTGTRATKKRPAIAGVPILHYTQYGIVPRDQWLRRHPKLHTSELDMDPLAPTYVAVQFAALGASPLNPQGRVGERLLVLER